MTLQRRVGIYLDSASVLANPDYVPLLQERIGLTLVILGYDGSPPPEVLAHSPLDGSPPTDACMHNLAAKHLDGGLVDPTEVKNVRSMSGPNFVAGDEDRLNRAIAQLRKNGVDVWMCVGGWTGRNMMFCPSKAAVNEWLEALYVHVATHYDIEAVDLTHARFPMGSVPRALFSCVCDDCAREAAQRGYDMEAMKAALRTAGTRLAEVDAGLLAQVMGSGVGLFDMVQLIGMRSGVVDWFRFRTELLGSKIKGFRSAVHAAAGPEFILGGDNYPASLAMFVGHDYSRWGECCDFASPLLSHADPFICRALTSWAEFLQHTSGLSEGEALQIVYRLVGYDDLGLPECIADYGFDEPGKLVRSIPLAELIIRELRKARLLLPASLPSYPIIQGGGWPRPIVDRIVQGADDAGHNGIIWQGTSQLVDFEMR